MDAPFRLSIALTLEGPSGLFVDLSGTIIMVDSDTIDSESAIIGLYLDEGAQDVQRPTFPDRVGMDTSLLSLMRDDIPIPSLTDPDLLRSLKLGREGNKIQVDTAPSMLSDLDVVIAVERKELDGKLPATEWDLLDLRQRLERLTPILDYHDLVSRMLHYNATGPVKSIPASPTVQRPETPHVSPAKELSERWSQDYRYSRLEYGGEIHFLRAFHKFATEDNNLQELARVQKQKRKLNRCIYEDWASQNLREQLQPRIQETTRIFDELEQLNVLFKANRAEILIADRTPLELVDEVDQLQKEVQEAIDLQLEKVEDLLEPCDAVLGHTASRIRKDVTRLHRLTAVDVRDEELRREEQAKRWGHEAVPRILLRTCVDIEQTRAEMKSMVGWLDCAKERLEAVEQKVNELEDAGEMAALALMRQELRNGLPDNADS
jgi:hypothetical protein